MAANQLRKKKNRSARGHLPDRSQHQLHEFLHRVLLLLRLLSPLGSKDGYVLSHRNHPRKNRRDHRARRHRHPDAGRSASPICASTITKTCCAPSRSASRSMHLHCFSAPEILCIAEVSGSLRARHHRAPARRRPRLHSRRRRGNSRRRNPRAHLAPQVHRRRMGAHAPHRARAGPAHHGHHDVRLRRRAIATASTISSASAASRKIPAASPRSFPGFSRRKILRSARACPKPRPSII